MSISISGNGVITGATTSYSFDQSVSIGGTLTYEDVTNIDSVGVITARSGIDVGPTSTTVINANGSATFASSALEIASTGNLSINRTSATNDILNGKLNGSVTSTINADGLVALGDASNSTGNNGLYLGGQNGSLNIYTDRYSTDCFQILNTSGSGTNVALKVYGKGDVEIAGIIQSNIQSAGNIELDSTAAFTSPTIKLFASNGSAEFSGYLRNDRFTTKAGLSLNLSGTDYAFAAYQDSANPLATIGVDGTATFKNKLTVQVSSASATDSIDIWNSTSGGDNRVKIRTYANGGGDPYLFFDGGGSNMVVGKNYQGSTSNELVMGTGNSAGAVTGLRINGLGAATFDSSLSVTGALSKGSGSFKIDHPLPAKTETHHLVHSFIEGPQADLIYRGVVTLTAGTVTIDLDEAARMTTGTFVLLNTNVSCFTSNESDWTAVKGSVTGNVLTITAQDNTSTATVSWMVVGERKDQHMIDTNWTDDTGRVITEPVKS